MSWMTLSCGPWPVSYIPATILHNRADSTVTKYLRGISYTGVEHIGFYKLEMTFNENTTVITKLPLSQRPQQYAAAIMDHLLDDFFKKLKTISKKYSS